MLCATIGIDVDLKKTYFSGFSHQGQGASFTADINIIELINGINERTYLSHAPQIKKEVGFNPEPCPIDKRVIGLIDRGLLDVSVDAKADDRPYSTNLNFSAGYELDSTHTNLEKQLNNLETWLEDIINDLDSMFFKLLENEYEYQTSEEAIIETIEANEYEFKEDGTRF